MTNSVRKKLFFKLPVGDVWDYLTKPELLAQWLMENDFKPVVGHVFQFRGGEEDGPGHGVATCEVLEVIPNRLLSYTWKGSCHGEKVDSLVIWSLSEKNGGTELRLEHNGFDLFAQLMSHNAGWQDIFTKLEQLSSKPHNVHTNS